MVEVKYRKGWQFLDAEVIFNSLVTKNDGETIWHLVGSIEFEQKIINS